jgi:hypothetical protein
MVVSSVAPARPILAYSRETGAFLELVPSASQPGKFHLVDPIARTCDCRGFEFRRRCRHLSPLALSRPLADGGAAHLAVLRASGTWPTKPVEPCGICDQVHACHCSRVKSWCDRCPPLGGGR